MLASFDSVSSPTTCHVPLCNHCTSACPLFVPETRVQCPTRIEESVFKFLHSFLFKHRNGLFIQVIPLPSRQNLFVKTVQRTTPLYTRNYVYATMRFNTELMPLQFDTLKQLLHKFLCDQYSNNHELEMTLKSLMIVIPFNYITV